MELGERLDAWLRLRGFTQKAFAKAVGVSEGAVSAWVNGVSPPNFKNLQAICLVLRVTMAEFHSADLSHVPPKARRQRLAA